jgi:hypothetical protein
MAFLDKAMESFFTDASPVPVERNSLELLQNVYNLLQRELGVHATRKGIDTALTGFVNHHTPTAWLDGLW